MDCALLTCQIGAPQKVSRKPIVAEEPSQILDFVIIFCYGAPLQQKIVIWVSRSAITCKTLLYPTSHVHSCSISTHTSSSTPLQMLLFSVAVFFPSSPSCHTDANKFACCIIVKLLPSAHHSSSADCRVLPVVGSESKRAAISGSSLA